MICANSPSPSRTETDLVGIMSARGWERGVVCSGEVGWGGEGLVDHQHMKEQEPRGRKETSGMKNKLEKGLVIPYMFGEHPAHLFDMVIRESHVIT